MRRILALCLLLTIAESVFAGEPAEVRRWVRQLNAPTIDERDAAEQALLGLEGDVLDQLPEVNAQMPAEVQHRLERVRQTLEQRAATAAVAASTVTLAGKDLSLLDVLKTIEQQTGNRLETESQQIEPAVGTLRVAAEFDKTPFWPAIDDLLDQSQLTYYFYAGENSLPLMNRPPGQRSFAGRVAYGGPFRFEPLELVAVRDLTNVDNQVLKLEMLVAWEPRLRPITLRQPLDKIKAVDAEGRDLPVTHTGSELLIEVQQGRGAETFSLPFRLPPRATTKIARLEGEMSALVPGRREAFRFDQIATAKDVAQRRGGVTVTLERLRKNNDLWEARVRIAYQSTGGALESHRDWVADNQCYLLDAAGERHDNLGADSTLRTESAVGFAYLFDLPNGPDGFTLVYETPAAIVTLPVKYTFTDLELP